MLMSEPRETWSASDKTPAPPEVRMERFGIDELAQELITQGYLDNQADARRAASKIILAVEEGSDDDQGIENAG
jgi:hypothetical protein